MGNPLNLVPCVAYPRQVEPGTRYLVTVDFHWNVSQPWPYGREEYLVRCEIDGGRWFQCHVLDNAATVIHRFGGTYGPATFVLTLRDPLPLPNPAQKDVPQLRLSLKNMQGSRLDSFVLRDIEVVDQGGSTKSEQIMLGRKRGTTAAESSQRDSGRLKIRVVGSIPAGVSSHDFNEFCENLGWEIGFRNHTLVITSLSQADGAALKGFASINPDGNVILVHEPEETPKKLLYEELRVASIAARDHRVAGAIQAADVVIAVGGKSSTDRTCSLALELGLPVIPLPHLGGSAAERYSQAMAALQSIDRDQYQRVESKRIEITDHEFLLDLLERWYITWNALLRVRRSAAVCRLKLQDGNFGVGFLIAPRLLITAHHVLPDVTSASNCRVLRESGLRETQIIPSELFFTDRELDLTLVALTPTWTPDGAVRDWNGVIPLRFESDIADGELVRILGYDNEGDVIEISGQVVYSSTSRFLDYDAESTQGQSGAPVFDRRWNLIGLHHRSLERYVNRKRGTRPAAIIKALQSSRFAENALVREVLRRASDASSPTPHPLPDGAILICAENGGAIHAIVKRLEKNLVDAFGRDAIVLEWTARSGINIRDEAERLVNACKILLIVIPESKSSRGARLQQSASYLNELIQRAIEIEKIIVPIYLEDASLNDADWYIQEQLEHRVNIQGGRLRHAHFMDDFVKLLRDISEILRPLEEQHTAASEPDTIVAPPPLSEIVHVLRPLVYSDDPGVHHGEHVVTRGNHTVYLSSTPFRIALHPVTNEFFQSFITAGGYERSEFWDDRAEPASFRSSDGTPGPLSWLSSRAIPIGLERHPVSGVCYYEAVAFIRWLQKEVKTGEAEWIWMLPTEDMWEFAARSEDGRLYPWGAQWNDGLCNSRESQISGTSEIGRFPRGKSPLGCHDMAGNVWEFVGASDQNTGNCVLRGGSYRNDQFEVRSILRLVNVPKHHRAPDFGFRVAQVSNQPVPS